jgi:hypothetical protein
MQMDNMDSSSIKVMASLHRDTVNQQGTSQFPRAMDSRDTSHKATNNHTSMVNSQHMVVNSSTFL